MPLFSSRVNAGVQTGARTHVQTGARKCVLTDTKLVMVIFIISILYFVILINIYVNKSKSVREDVIIY